VFAGDALPPAVPAETAVGDVVALDAGIPPLG
jgi:hypothetical protein